MRNRIARHGRQVMVFASVVAMVALAGCVSPPSSDMAIQEVCAKNVSITEVAVTIQAAPIDSTIHMEIPWEYVDQSDGGTFVYPNVIGPLDVGQTYFLPNGFNYWGYLDLGRCLDVVASPGVKYQLTAFTVLDPRVMLAYAAVGGHIPFESNKNTGHLP